MNRRAGQEPIGLWITGFGIPFVLVLYLALRGGGYDSVVRGEVATVVWLAVLIGALAGLLPRLSFKRRTWVIGGVLFALVAWTALATLWSESAERTVTEVVRVATYLGVFALAVGVQRRDGLTRTVNAIAAAIAIVGALALLSRLHPGWFPQDDLTHVYPTERGRLDYPLNHWNGLAALLAIGVPLLLSLAVQGRHLVTKVISTAALPVLALAAFFTYSRGGPFAVAVGLTAFLILYPRRLEALPVLGVAALGGGLLILLATHRDALEQGPGTPLAADQGTQMLLITLAVVALVALARWGIERARERQLVPVIEVSRRTAVRGAVAVAAVLIVGAIAAGVPSELESRWEEFKQPVNLGSGSYRYESSSGNGRYQYWQSALDANATAPIGGIGPGTFEFWWARNGTISGFVRDAHSLYFETLGELGIVGLALVLGLIGGVFVAGVRRWRVSYDHQRGLIAGALGATAAFALGAGIDWLWEIAVIPVVFVLLAAALVQAPDEEEREGELSVDRVSRWGRERIVLAAIAVPALIVTVTSLIGDRLILSSQDDARSGDLASALSAAEDAASFQPYAATPHLQQALVLQLQHNLDAAAAQASEATRLESTDWRTWYTLSQIERDQGDKSAAAATYAHARSLNPRSPVFTGEPAPGTAPAP